MEAATPEIDLASALMTRLVDAVCSERLSVVTSENSKRTPLRAEDAWGISGIKLTLKIRCSSPMLSSTSHFVAAASSDAIRRSGGNPFRDEQLPQAVIALKQGACRLIRTERDRGVLVLCDPRLTQKSYGRVFLESLPPIPRTRELADVQAFFADN